MSQVKDAVVHVASHRGNVPILRLALGLLLIVFFILALILQVQTSEAFILNGGTVTFAANWSVLGQPADFLQGHLSVNMAKAVMWGWGIELVYLVCVIGEVSATKFHNWFKTGAIILVVFDFWTDFSYGALPSGWGGQIAFAAVTAFIVAFFGVIGLNLIFSAITDMAN